MNRHSSKGHRLLGTEDTWAIWLGLVVMGGCLVTFWGGSSLAPWAVTPGTWRDLTQLGSDLAAHGMGYVSVYAGYGIAFALSMAAMGRDVRRFLLGYTALFAGSLGIFYLAGWSVVKQMDLGAPLLALLIGLAVGNVWRVPDWLKASLRTEYYIKTGIVLLGATLPLTLIAEAGPVAFLQATMVSIVTWLTIYLAATRWFGLDPRFGAVLGTGGAVCGVSGSIAIGGAVKADKDHIAIGIAVVSIWAIVMIFALAVATKWLIPEQGQPPTAWYEISPGEAGAWVGTSEYADAAGFAVVAELASKHGDAPIYAFTLMKVIGRDIWIGIWALVLSIVSVVFWERKRQGSDVPSGRLGISVVWERFPKFVLGFFAASVLMSFVATNAPTDYVGRASVRGTFRSNAQRQTYAADFDAFRAPESLRDAFGYDAQRGEVTFRGKMTLEQLAALSAGADPQQLWALKELHHRSDWFASELQPKVIGPIKRLRSWAFVLCFLCIGLATRFRDLATFGLKPFWAFSVGVLVNVPLGFVLTTQVFDRYWRAIGQ